MSSRPRGGRSTPSRLAPVAKAVAWLERRLGAMLFKRTTRRLSLAAEGVVYRDTCQSARRDIARVETALASLARELAGMVTVSLPPLLGASVLAPALYALCRQWPALRFGIDASTERADLLDGTVDLVVRIGETPDLTGRVARRPGTQRIFLCASCGYLARQSQPRSVENLSDHRLIGTMQGGRAAPWHFEAGDGVVRPWHPAAPLLLDGSLLTLSAIREGHGIGMVQRWLVREEIAAGRLMTVFDGAVAGHLPVHALWSSSPTMLPRLRVAIDALVAAARSLER